LIHWLSLVALLQSFERVVVQNILHGLSPSLCEAIESVSRWRVVRAAFPHILHCCAAMLLARDHASAASAAAGSTDAAADASRGSPPKFSTTEVRPAKRLWSSKR